MIPVTYNPKYQTTPCRHWQQTGSCKIGARCHFAHGNIPPGTTGYSDPKLMMGNLGANTKTVQCRYFELGLCRYGDNCHFAHSDADVQNAQMLLQNQTTDPSLYQMELYKMMLLQQQQQQMQMTGVMTGGMMGATGFPGGATAPSTTTTTGQTDGTSAPGTSTTPTVSSTTSMPNPTYSIENDPNVQKYITLKQLQFIIAKVAQLPSNTTESKNKLKLAQELWKAQNIQGCSLMLNEVINKKDVKEDQRKAFQGIINEASQLAVELMSAYQIQVSTMQMQQQQQMYQLSQQGLGGQTQ